MKKIVITVTDDKAKEILGIIIGEVDEITVTRVGDDPEATATPEPIRRVHRGDKRATDIVMEMFDDVNHTRTMESIQKHLVGLGFAEGTYTSVVSKLVTDGLVRREKGGLVVLVKQSP